MVINAMKKIKPATWRTCDAVNGVGETVREGLSKKAQEAGHGVAVAGQIVCGCRLFANYQKLPSHSLVTSLQDDSANMVGSRLMARSLDPYSFSRAL